MTVDSNFADLWFVVLSPADPLPPASFCQSHKQHFPRCKHPLPRARIPHLPPAPFPDLHTPSCLLLFLYILPCCLGLSLPGCTWSDEVKCLLASAWLILAAQRAQRSRACSAPFFLFPLHYFNRWVSKGDNGVLTVMYSRVVILTFAPEKS